MLSSAEPVTMHPEYLDYLPKRKVRFRAEWFDVKNLVGKVVGLSHKDFYLVEVHDGIWHGWLVEFNDVVDYKDIDDLKLAVAGVLILGDQAVFISIIEDR